MTSRSAHLPSVRGNMIDVEFKHLTKQKFNGEIAILWKCTFRISFELFILECKDHNIDLETSISSHRKYNSRFTV